MNFIDLVLIAIILLATYYCLRKGFIDSAIEIFIWLGSFIAALFLSGYITRLLNHLFTISDLFVRPLSFIVMLVICSRIIFIIGDNLSDNISESAHQHWANKAAGILPGLFSGFIYALLLSLFLISYPVGIASQRTKESFITNSLTTQSGWLNEKISVVFKDMGYEFGRSLTVHPKNKEIVSLPFNTSDVKVRKDLEMRMLDLLNREREKKGLNSLQFDNELAQVARKHSRDMFQRGYFSHFTPEGKSPFDRIRRDKISFRIAGENLALAQNLDLAHSGLMESPTHKANILHKSFGRVGIGILDGGIYGIIVTQNFRN